MQMIEFPLSDVVSEAAWSFQALAQTQGKEFSCEIQPMLSITGNEKAIHQLVGILLDNALKYSTPGGMVSVDVTSTVRGCVLSVASPGEAISKEDLKNIFKRFYRADKARAMNGSYGLGLSIAESIVEAHKGKIWAESRNGYNTFFVQLITNS